LDDLRKLHSLLQYKSEVYLTSYHKEHLKNKETTKPKTLWLDTAAASLPNASVKTQYALINPFLAVSEGEKK